MLAPRPGRVAALSSLVPVVLLTGACGVLPFLGGGGPSEAEWVELVELEDRSGRLAEVAVTDVAASTGDWKFVRGTAVLAQDLYSDSVDSGDVAGACGVDPLDLPPAGTGRQVVEPTAAAGSPVEFEFEFVAERPDDDRPEDVTASGWTLPAAGGDFSVEGTPSYDLGFPLDWYGGDVVVLGSEEFEAYCAGLTTGT